MAAAAARKQTRLAPEVNRCARAGAKDARAAVAAPLGFCAAALRATQQNNQTQTSHTHIPHTQKTHTTGCCTCATCPSTSARRRCMRYSAATAPSGRSECELLCFFSDPSNGAAANKWGTPRTPRTPRTLRNRHPTHNAHHTARATHRTNRNQTKPNNTNLKQGHPKGHQGHRLCRL